MNLCDLFALSFKGRRDAVGIEFQGREYTFGDMDTRSNRIARLFAARGLGLGDRLCCYLVNPVGMIDAYLAFVKPGVIFVPINILYRDGEITHILGNAAPKALVTDADIATDAAIRASRLTCAVLARPFKTGPILPCWRSALLRLMARRAASSPRP